MLDQLWCAAIDGWMAALTAAGRPATTRRLRRYQLGRLAGWAMAKGLGPWDVDGDALVEFLAAQGWSRETLRSWGSALRRFYRWAHGTGKIAADPTVALPTVRKSDPNPRPAPEDAFRLALACSDDRVRLMLRLAAELGLRRGEVARCRRDDLTRDLLGWSLQVVGKGARVRVLPVSDGLAAAIRVYRPEPGFLFPGAIEGHLSPHYVGKLVARALPEAWSMHSLRHRFGTAAYAHDRDVFTVQELMGHASPVTTRLYVKVPAESLRRTIVAVAALV